MYVCIYIYMYVYLQIYMYICLYIHTYILYACVNTYVYTHIHRYVCAYIYTHIYVCIWIYESVCVCAYVCASAHYKSPVCRNQVYTWLERQLTVTSATSSLCASLQNTVVLQCVRWTALSATESWSHSLEGRSELKFIGCMYEVPHSRLQFESGRCLWRAPANLSTVYSVQLLPHNCAFQVVLCDTDFRSFARTGFGTNRKALAWNGRKFARKLQKV